MEIEEIALKIAERHYSSKPNAEVDEAYRLNMIETLKFQITDEFKQVQALKLVKNSVMQSVIEIPLEQQIENAILDNGGVLKGALNEIIVIAKIFAIEFALWKETIMQDENGMYFSESRAQISRKNPVDINGLLEVYERVRSETVA